MIRLFFGLLYALPAVLFFSYYPIISFGSDATMNFELSLPLIWLVLFAIVSFILLIQHRKSLSFRPCSTFSLFAIFVAYATLSTLWSPNKLRAILTSGVLALTAFAVFSIVYLLPRLSPSRNFRRLIIKSLTISTTVVCLYCWIQCLLDTCGLSRNITLLCPGCTYQTFGFPHPSGLAIEPQFMGNLLLAPTLFALYQLAFRPQTPKSQSLAPHQLVFCAIFWSATLFLTLSRGAIYAFAVALVILFIFAIIQHRRRLLLIVIPVISFVITLTAQGTFSALSPTSDTFISGTTKVIHQLSLGLIDFRPKSTPVSPVENPVENNSHFDGYIPASTNIRLGLSAVALKTWHSNPRYLLIGTGLGGAGLAMHAAYPDHELAVPKVIVQNEPVSLLLELGLVGVALLLAALFFAFSPHSPFWHHPALPLLTSLIVAYLVTLQFFSGLPNALHIYLLPPLFYFIFGETTKVRKSKYGLYLTEK